LSDLIFLVARRELLDDKCRDKRRTVVVYNTLALMSDQSWFTPDVLLSVSWRGLPSLALAAHLRRVLIAEHKCFSGQWPRRIAPVFRWRRLSIARHLLSVGGQANRLVLAHKIPRGPVWSSREHQRVGVPVLRRWPGASHLVPLQPQGENEG
jgi:hypothetical protein